MICIEGIIGSGKTTQVELLHRFLSPRVAMIPELNHLSPLKEAIARWKVRIKDGRILFKKEDILGLARARSITQRAVLESLPKSEYLLSDRGAYTSLVYEWGELNFYDIEKINRAEGVVFPDEGFILDCEPKIALLRTDERRGREGRYQNRSIHETVEELTKRQKLYMMLQQLHPELRLVNANGTIDEVFSCISQYY